MQTCSKRIHKLIWLSILPVLLLGFATRGLPQRARTLHARTLHRAVRTGSRTGEVSMLDQACGDAQTSGVISLHTHGDHPPQTTPLSFAALTAVAPRTFAADHFVLLARSSIDPDVRPSAFDSSRLRGPPSILFL
jgi:hypothetical protein